ncbi:MAG TPA: SDR family NAD(P)-dependent oxidoreductase [Acidimicrobiales bacterium]|nr:SDR family NAD(P)-dependent oxidoreductase [Acidimicrobiales bacterium]
MGEFDGRVALVTGGGSGIGRQVAKHFAREGATVLVTDVSVEGGEETVAQIAAEEDKTAVFAKMDVTRADEVASVVEELSRSMGDISLLLVCAGVSSIVPFLKMTEADWDFNMDVNAKGVFLVLREVVARMAERGRGEVVVIASAASKGGGPNLAHYCASKWAVLGLVQSVAREVARKGVRVNAVCPGFVRTPMQDREVVWEGELRGIDPEEVRRSYVEHTPLGRVCEPEDVADVMVFLCSDKARFMTGQAVNVTGGMVMH